ncbi:MAG: tRNA uridine-5-carboxymethylaminomethyl(34) synthesis GTPase MnmE [Kiritimatiellia bacterium]
MIGGETIAAIATASGRGGVAVVRVSGPEALAIAVRLTGRQPKVGGATVAKLRSPRRPADAGREAGDLLDEAVVLAFRAPHSYTGEDVVEFQCHGGAVTPRRVLEACFAAGARLARRGEFTQRAFLNGKLDYDQAEAVLSLVDAKTARAADAALAGLSGRRQRELQDLYAAALDLSAQLEHALDLDEGELPPDFLPAVGVRLSDLLDRLRSAIRRANEGRILRRGALVVLTGPPNAGKSSLMNALLEEERAIVSDAPGTTRDAIEEGLDLDGWPIRLVDTAGLRTATDAVETEGVRRAEDLVARADVVLALGAFERFGADDGRVLRLHAKCDLGHGDDGLNVSAKTGEGLERLKRALVAKLAARTADADGPDAEADTAPLLACVSLLSPLVSGRDAAGPSELVLAANAVRSVSERLGALVGAVYSSDLLDNLFSRFCVGK